MADKKMIGIGLVVRAHGIRGEVKVLPHTAESGVIPLLTSLHLKKNGIQSVYDMESCRCSGRFYLVKLQNCDDRDQAYELTNSEVLIRRDDFPELREGEYYNCDLLGCEVILENGQCLGELKDIVSTGAHDILSITTTRGKEIMLPFNEENVHNIDISSKRIYVSPIPGLLDVYLQDPHHFSRDDRPAASDERDRESS